MIRRKAAAPWAARLPKCPLSPLPDYLSEGLDIAFVGRLMADR
jgi:hypothetical protein